MRLIAIVTASMIIIASCSGSAEPDSDFIAASEPQSDVATTAPGDDPKSTTTAELLTASFTGVTSDTIAIVSVDFAKLRELFGVELDYQDQQPVLDPLIDDLNESGGINGRSIEPIYVKFLPVGSADADRVCIEVTEDIGVFAVFGGFVGPGAQEVNLCLTEMHQTVLVGLSGTAEQLERAKAPWIVDGMGQLRQSLALIKLLNDQGLLADRVAIWSSNNELYPLIPEIREALTTAGSEVVMTGTQSAPAFDLTASDDEYSLFLDRAMIEGAKAVYWLGNGLSPPKIHAADSPDIEIYAPLAEQIVGALRAVPDVEKAQIYGVGTFPKAFREDPLLDRCISVVEAATDIIVTRHEETRLGEPDWYQAVAANCRQLEIFRLAATAAGPNLTNDTFLAAAESLGSFDLAGGAASSIRPGKHDVTDSTRLVEFDMEAHGKGDFVPVGPVTVFG